MESSLVRRVSLKPLGFLVAVTPAIRRISQQFFSALIWDRYRLITESVLKVTSQVTAVVEGESRERQRREFHLSCIHQAYHPCHALNSSGILRIESRSTHSTQTPSAQDLGHCPRSNPKNFRGGLTGWLVDGRAGEERLLATDREPRFQAAQQRVGR